jgi:FAS-associated factor 2
MSVIARVAGAVPTSAFVAKLQTGISNYSEQLATVRSARSAQQFERTLRQEQDSAYERSLAQDRERTRQRREAEAAAAEAQRKAAEAEAAEEARLKALEQWKKWRATKILPEPAADDKDSVRIALRMPESAERITRRFPGSAEIEELYAFVECYDVLSSISEADSDIVDPGVKHEYGFRLVSPVPRMVYELSDGGSIGQRIGRSGNLIVEPIIDEDEEDEE